MANLVLSARAETDLVEIWDWIDRDDPATANRVLEGIHRVCMRLEGTPRMGRPRPELGEGFRSLVYERWLIVYRILDPDSIVIARVVSSARDLAHVRFDVS
jgi:toxin ParE1/3/4